MRGRTAISGLTTRTYRKGERDPSSDPLRGPPSPPSQAGEGTLLHDRLRVGSITTHSGRAIASPPLAGDWSSSPEEIKHARRRPSPPGAGENDCRAAGRTVRPLEP